MANPQFDEAAVAMEKVLEKIMVFNFFSYLYFELDP
jgi:hypothetical protein